MAVFRIVLVLALSTTVASQVLGRFSRPVSHISPIGRTTHTFGVGATPAFATHRVLGTSAPHATPFGAHDEIKPNGNGELISFDFDGTLHSSSTPAYIGAPLYNNIEKLKRYAMNNYNVIITTARGPEDNDEVWAFLHRVGIAHHVQQIFNTDKKGMVLGLLGATKHFDDRESNMEDISLWNPNIDLRFENNEKYIPEPDPLMMLLNIAQGGDGQHGGIMGALRGLTGGVNHGHGLHTPVVHTPVVHTPVVHTPVHHASSGIGFKSGTTITTTPTHVTTTTTTPRAHVGAGPITAGVHTHALTPYEQRYQQQQAQHALNQVAQARLNMMLFETLLGH